MGYRDPLGIRGEQAASWVSPGATPELATKIRPSSMEARGGKKKKEGTGEDRSPGFAASDGHKPGLSSWKTERNGIEP